MRILVSKNVKKHVINQFQYISTEYTELISSTFETGIVGMDSLHLFISMQKPLLIYMSAFTKRYSGTIADTQSNVYAIFFTDTVSLGLTLRKLKTVVKKSSSLIKENKRLLR